MADAQHWWSKLINWRTLPLKPKHVDELAARRRERFKHVASKAADRQSFKAYWREQERKDKTLIGMPRRERRRVRLARWRATK